MTMPLSIITPTRRRWHSLRKQARAIAGQVSADDRWIIVVDNDQANQRVVNEIAEIIPAEQLIWLHCSYARPTPPIGCVNRLRNAAAALAPARHDIVEVDDHDLLAPYALAEIRMALAAGYDYVFGWYHQQAMVENPPTSVGNALCGVPRADALRGVWQPIEASCGGDSRNPGAPGEGVPYRYHKTSNTHLEPWPDVEHRYTRGGFERREIDGIGVRAFKRWLWIRLGGWATHVWPGGDYHFALRAEAIGAKIVCIEQPLCTVTIEAESISANARSLSVSLERRNVDGRR